MLEGSASEDVINLIRALELGDDSHALIALVIVAICFIALIISNIPDTKRLITTTLFSFLCLGAVLFLCQTLISNSAAEASRQAIENNKVSQSELPAQPDKMSDLLSDTYISNLEFDRAVEALTLRKVREYEANTQTRTTSASVRCQNMGDEESRVAHLYSGLGWVFDSDIRSSTSGQYDDYGSIEISTLDDGQQVASQRIRCRSPRQLFGPGAWANVQLTVSVRRVADEQTVDRLRAEATNELNHLSNSTTESEQEQ